jgi:hypothetical protein
MSCTSPTSPIEAQTRKLEGEGGHGGDRDDGFDDTVMLLLLLLEMHPTPPPSPPSVQVWAPIRLWGRVDGIGAVVDSRHLKPSTARVPLPGNPA